MIRINLLPYRAERRLNQILQHIAALLLVISITGLGIFIADLWKSSELTTLEDEFAELKSQNDILRIKIGKIKDLDKLRADVERKLALVDELQMGRFHSLVSLSGLAGLIPENVWLSNIKDSGGSLSISGMGESNKAVANFMRALDESPLFANVSLQTIARSQSGGIPIRQFSLTLSRVVETAHKNKPKKGASK
jgi:type IV pilus assembly protein PilN